MDKLGRFARAVVPPEHNGCGDIIVTKHACDSFRARMRYASDAAIIRQLQEMLSVATVATKSQKQIIFKSCSHSTRQFMYVDDYEQYIHGDVVLCVAINIDPRSEVIQNARFITTIYFKQGISDE